jgi:hypothetical protein
VEKILKILKLTNIKSKTRTLFCIFELEGLM